MAKLPKEPKREGKKLSDDDVLRRMLSTPPKPHKPAPKTTKKTKS